MSYKNHFARFLSAQPDRLHFAAHSHHPWPDVSFDAQQQCWLDAARLADEKWDQVFGEVLPRAQTHVARALSLPDPRSLAFAPSTHELVMRLWSCLPRATPRVLTTDGEFHSFSRQMRRLEEEGLAAVTRVAVDPYDTFAERFAAAAAQAWDLVYFSQCFYNTAFRIVELAPLVQAVRAAGTLVVIDGYHSFMAQPVDLAPIAKRVFYLAGGYKYAMAGEGACFMHCPPGYAERPVNTGWFASFGTLTKAQNPGEVPFAAGGQRFMGATFDPTALYRLNAVQDWLLGLKLGVAQIRAHVEALQALFLELRRQHGVLRDAELLPPQNTPRGNFLVLRHPDARQWRGRLLAARVQTDCRDDRLRIGFGIYQDAGDVEALIQRLRRLGL